MKAFIIGIIGFLIAVSVVVIIRNSREVKPSSPISKEETASTPTPDNHLTTYNDESGFAFQYPQGIMIGKKSVSNLIYSSLELTATGSADTVTVRAEESSLNTVDDFFKGASKTSVYGEVTKTKLADMDARQFEANNSRSTIALDQGVLFTISTNAKKNTDLSKTYETIIKTFAFVQPTENQASSQDQADIIEEE